MANHPKLAALLGTIVLSFSLVSESQASISMPLRNWTQTPTVTGNATWDFLSFTNLSPTTVPLVFNETITNGVETLVLTIGDSSHLLPPGVYDLKYSISLDGATFETATLNANLTGVFPAATVTKSFFTSPTFSPTAFVTLTSVNGKSASTGADNGLSTIFVDELVSVTGGEIISLGNSFTTTTSTVPEPASLLVWGILGGGLVATAALHGRRRAALPAHPGPMLVK